MNKDNGSRSINPHLAALQYATEYGLGNRFGGGMGETKKDSWLWLGIQLFFRSSVPNVLFLFFPRFRPSFLARHSLWETRLQVVSKIRGGNDWQLQKGEQYNGDKALITHSQSKFPTSYKGSPIWKCSIPRNSFVSGVWFEANGGE